MSYGTMFVLVASILAALGANLFFISGIFLTWKDWKKKKDEKAKTEFFTFLIFEGLIILPCTFAVFFEYFKALN